MSYELVRKFKHKKAIVFNHRAEFMWSAFLIGMENLLMDFLAAPEFAHRLLDKVLEVNIAVARNAIRAGADVSNSGMITPAHRVPCVAPCVQRVHAAAAQENGGCYP